MTINSYFYDSANGDRKYSATDFAAAFNIILDNGVLLNPDGTLGLDIDSAANPIIYAGKAVVNGRFIELIGTEVPTIPTGSYSGQIVLRVDGDGERKASIVAKTNRTPAQGTSLFELPLYDIAVTNGSITSYTDKRVRGGAEANAYKPTEVDTLLATKVRKYEATDSSYLLRNASNYFYGRTTPNANYLISVRDTQHADRFLLIHSHFQDGSFNTCTTLVQQNLTYAPNTFGTITINGLAGSPLITVVDLGKGYI